MTEIQALETKREPTLVDLMLRVHLQFVNECDFERYSDLPPHELRLEIRNATHSACDSVCGRDGTTLSPSDRDWLIESVLDEAFGLGPLEPLLKEPATEAIIIKSPRVVLVEREGRTWDSAVVFRDDDHVRNILERDRWKDYVTEVSEAGVRSNRIDVRRLREAFAMIEAESKVKVNPVSNTSRESRSPMAQSWIVRLSNWLFPRH